MSPFDFLLHVYEEPPGVASTRTGAPMFIAVYNGQLQEVKYENYTLRIGSMPIFLQRFSLLRVFFAVFPPFFEPLPFSLAFSSHSSPTLLRYGLPYPPKSYVDANLSELSSPTCPKLGDGSSKTASKFSKPGASMAAFGRLPGGTRKSHTWDFNRNCCLLACFCWFLKDSILCWKFLFGMRKMKDDICHDMFMSMYISIFSIKHLNSCACLSY